MNSLKIGISGVRGVLGETFTPELAVAFAQAFGTCLDAGRILLCPDAPAVAVGGRELRLRDGDPGLVGTPL